MEKKIEIIPFPTESSEIMARLVNLDQEVFSAEESWSVENFKKELPNKSNLSSLIVENNKIVGFLIGSSYWWDDIEIAHLNRIVISKYHESKGYGKALLNALVSNCTLIHIQHITLECKNSSALVHFYAKNGFKQFDKENIKKYLRLKNKTHRLQEFLEEEFILFEKKISLDQLSYQNITNTLNS